MPKTIVLSNQHIGVLHSKELDEEQTRRNGQPSFVEVWTLVFTDRTYGDQVRITFRKEAKDDIVQQLTGIALPGDLSV